MGYCTAYLVKGFEDPSFAIVALSCYRSNVLERNWGECGFIALPSVVSGGLYSWMKMNNKVRRTRTSFVHQCHWDIFLSAVNGSSWCLFWTELRATINSQLGRELKFYATLREVSRNRILVTQSANMESSSVVESKWNTCLPNLRQKIPDISCLKNDFLHCMWHPTSVSWFEIFVGHFRVMILP